MKTTIFRSSWNMILIAGALVAPAQLPAQRADSARTHVVRPGDTLWALSARYLGDGERWREILALNPSLQNTSSLTVGATIRIPVTRATPKRAADAPRREPGVDVRPAPSAPDTLRRTIFFGARPAGGFVRPDSLAPVTTDSGIPASVFEGVSAPFVTDPETLDRGGHCVAVGPARAAEARGVLLQGTLEVQLPAGSTTDSASRWLLVRRGPVLDELGVVAIPTGVVRLTSSSGGAATAEVVAQFDAMACTDVILPAVVPPAPPGGRLTPVTDGASGRVAWVASQSALPTLQHALILDIGAEAGVRPGDRVTVYGGRGGGSVVASADIVRVDRRASTALVVRQSLGSLAVGQRVRVTEKLP